MWNGFWILLLDDSHEAVSLEGVFYDPGTSAARRSCKPSALAMAVC